MLLHFQTAVSSSNIRSMLDAALDEYKKKTRDDLLSHQLANELKTCDSVDAVLNILRDQSKAFEKSGDQRLMKSIDSLAHAVYTFPQDLGDGAGLESPPAKVIFAGIGVLLFAGKDAKASHGAIIDLFERIKSCFKHFDTLFRPTKEMTGVLVKIVIELLSILSNATKEVKRQRAKIFARNLLERTDIENALKRLDRLIQEQVRMAMAIMNPSMTIPTEVGTRCSTLKGTRCSTLEGLRRGTIQTELMRYRAKQNLTTRD
ncbi:hypothetical protein H4582DRAFT_279224 [Lactarius indigo]|nr:hypothetical protein H4582DRAFT_279224 [Lactarius indigo]